MGFGVSESTCSICGKSFGNFQKRECEHIRGRIYPIQRNGVTVREPCIQIIRKSEAYELSLVFLGADRDARITTKFAAYSEPEVANNNISAHYSNVSDIPNLIEPTINNSVKEPVMDNGDVLQERIARLNKK